MRHVLALLLLLVSATLAVAQGCGPANPNCIVPTAPLGTNDNRAASTAFVQSAVSTGVAGVASFNGRSGIVVSASGDYLFPQILGQTSLTQLPTINNNTILGNNSGGASTPSALTAAQLTALVNACTATTAGLVPTPPNNATLWLNGACGFTAPSFANITGSVTLAQLPSIANNTVLGNNSGGTTTPSALTQAQLTALIQVCTGTTGGAVPTPPNNTTTFLNGQCQFTTPAGGGTVTTTGTMVNGNCVLSAGGTVIKDSGSTNCGGGGGGGPALGWLDIKTRGATGDGICHPLSSAYANLLAAQAVYPFVSDLSGCIDWAAVQLTINLSYSTAPLVNGAFTTYCPLGNYQLSNPVFVDQANNTQGSYAAWAVGTTYGNGANVTYNGIPWVSMGSGNVGNPPTSMFGYPANFSIVNSGGGSIYPSGFPWATVAISNASPAVFTPLLGGGTLAVTANQPIVLFTQQVANPNGGSAPALPTGINAAQVYYVVGSSITSTTFTVSATPGGVAVNSSSVGVGNFFVSGQVWQVAAVQNAPSFSTRVSFIGVEGLPSNSGCQFTTQNNWTSPAFIVGPQNGLLIKNINVIGQVSGNPGDNGYKCTAPFSDQKNAGAQLGAAGWAIVSSGGGASKTRFENSGSSGGYIGDWRGYTGSGQLVDSNTWLKPVFSGNCINVFFDDTQAFINTIYDGSLNNATTNVVASVNEGVKVIGGNSSQFFGLATSFAISGVSTSNSCGNNFVICVVATITSPDNNLQSPMCSYSAGSAYTAQVKWLNSWPFASGCGYNTFMINTTRWGLVGMYVMNYNPLTAQITLGVPQAYAGIYQGTCCGSNFAAQLAAATTLYAAEAVIGFYGNNQVDSIHVENDGVPTSLMVFATSFFGGARTSELKNAYINTDASNGVLICCNRIPVLNNPKYTAWGYAQQVIPYFNATLGDLVLDGISGGFALASAPTSNFGGAMDRVTIATETSTYVEGRHMMGTNNGNISTGSGGNNAAGPLFDFANSSIGTSWLNTVPLQNPGTLGQLSGGFYAMGGSAYGSGVWDNPSQFVSSAAYSVNASNQPVDLADLWRSRGWGQTPYWGVRPAPYVSPCITPAQDTTLAALPAITRVSNLQDYLNVSGGGTGYTVNDVLTLVGGTGTAAQVFVTATGGGGAITAVQVQTKGAYTGTIPTTFTATGGPGTGATFNLPIWYVNYTIGYPLLWGGTIYKVCDTKGGGTFAGGTHQLTSSNTGWSYFQALTTTNVPNLRWTMDGASPFIYMNLEALELMFPGLVLGLVSDGSGGCTAIAQQNFMVLEVKPSLGYVKVVRTDTDGGPYVPSLAASGITCTNNTIAQQALNASRF
jgi:hypothetical protein